METTAYPSILFSDEEVIEKIKGGETAFFEILIRRHNATLYKIARSYGLNHQDAEDMMQEAHYAAFRQLHSFRKESSYKTWIARILLHQCYHKVNYGSGKYEHATDSYITGQDWIMPSASNKQDTEKKVLNKELAAILEQSLEGLPVLYRSVFVLREVEGFSVAETAALLDITPTNVKVRLNRAKAMLQKQLEQFYTTTELYEFHLRYCDAIVKNVFDRIRKEK